MKLEQQVCSLELAKRLKELGVKQESLFYWWPNKEEGATIHLSKVEGIVQEVFISAFTVAELGQMLPAEVLFKDIQFDLVTGKNNTGRGDEWWVGYYDSFDRQEEKISFQEPTEADARAKMLIYLLENNLTPASQDNPKE